MKKLNLFTFVLCLVCFYSGCIKTHYDTPRNELSVNEAELFHSKFLRYCINNRLNGGYLGPLSRKTGQGGFFAERPMQWYVTKSGVGGTFYFLDPAPYLGSRPPEIEEFVVTVNGKSHDVWVINRGDIERITSVGIVEFFEEIDKMSPIHFHYRESVDAAADNTEQKDPEHS